MKSEFEQLPGAKQESSGMLKLVLSFNLVDALELLVVVPVDVVVLVHSCIYDVIQHIARILS